jgi:hypothetical protein
MLRIFSTDWLTNLISTGSLTTIAAVATSTKTKWQTKDLLVAQTAFGAIPAMSFNNLTIGRSYRLTTHLYATFIGVAVDNITISASGAVAQTLWSFRWDSSAFTSSQTGDASIVFTALSTTLTLSMGGNTTSQTLQLGSTATLEELPNHEVTTQWT